ncbi:hypothetical protein ACQ86D_41830 [Streptomyces galilaeus]
MQQAVPPMPRSPLIPSSAELMAEQQALGLRHAADALFPSGRVRFRILDGLHVRGRAGRWSRVDAETLARARDGWLARADTATVDSLFARYGRIQASRPTALRRLVLYQLLRLLQAAPSGPTEHRARELGVDQEEAKALAHAADRAPRWTPDARAAAEEILDAWRTKRVRQAFDCALRLGEPGQDDGLGRLVLAITDEDRQTDALLARAAETERAGDRAGAADLYLEAAGIAVDDPRAVEGLLRTGADPQRRLTTHLVRGGLRLHWPAAGPHRVLRRGADPGPWTELAAHVDGGVFTDTAISPGTTAHYAVIPVDGPALRGFPLLAAPARYAPEVEGVRVVESRDRVSATWRTPPGVSGVHVERLAAQGSLRQVVSEKNGFDDTAVPPGDHRYLIRCRYWTPHDGETLSTGVGARITVHRWPGRVSRLSVTAGPRPGRIAVGWTGGDGCDVRLYEELRPALRPGAGPDLWTRELPEELNWDSTPLPHGVELLPPRRGVRLHLTAVSVVGELATIGASITTELAAPVTNFTVRRVLADRVRVTFDWPERAERVRIRWVQSGAESEWTLTRTAYTRTACELQVTPAAGYFSAEPVLPHADAVIEADPVVRHLPPDLEVSYDMTRYSWRSGARRRVTVRAHCAPAHRGEVELPDLVLIARAGEGPPGALPPRPRSPWDGVTLLRLTGAEIGVGTAVQRDIEVTVGDARPPYRVRAFLLGAGAGSARLVEPPRQRLVVR